MTAYLLEHALLPTGVAPDVLVEVLIPPVLVETPPVDVLTPPVEVLTPPVLVVVLLVQRLWPGDEGASGGPRRAALVAVGTVAGVTWGLLAVDLLLGGRMTMLSVLGLLPLDGGHIAGALWEAIKRPIARARGVEATLPDGAVVKAAELSGRSGLLFVRNSVTGTVEARDRTGHGIALNDALHAND